MVFLLVLGLLFSAPTPAQTAQSHRQRATELAREKSWDQAIASYPQALPLAPNDPDTHYHFALALNHNRDPKPPPQDLQPTPPLQPHSAHAPSASDSTS